MTTRIEEAREKLAAALCGMRAAARALEELIDAKLSEQSAAANKGYRIDSVPLHEWQPYGESERICKHCGIIDGATRGWDRPCLSERYRKERASALRAKPSPPDPPSPGDDEAGDCARCESFRKFTANLQKLKREAEARTEAAEAERDTLRLREKVQVGQIGGLTERVLSAEARVAAWEPVVLAAIDAINASGFTDGRGTIAKRELDRIRVCVDALPPEFRPKDCNCGLVYRQQIWDLKAELAALTESALADEQIHIEVRKEWLAEKGRLEKLAAGLTEQLRMAGIRPYYERRGD